jgi:hypothetical protein
MIDQRLKDIASSFTSNRDLHLRNQLNALSRDMQFITRTDPYANKLLDDQADQLSIEQGLVDADTRPLGSFAASFVDDVNDEMEIRDAGLTDIDVGRWLQQRHATIPNWSH